MKTDRRSFVKMCAAGGAAAMALRTNVAGAAEPSAVPSPRKWSPADLQGLTGLGLSVLLDSASRAAASEDFGHLTRGSSLAVALPRTPAEVESLLGFAHSRGLPLTPRGVGHSQGGHAVALNAVTLDLSRMDRVEKPRPDAQTIVCEPGARWRSVVAATVPLGLIPPVLPLNLDLTVAGTIAVGGIGPGSHHFGPAAANVQEMEVVPGRGRRLTCSPTKEKALYEATLAGLGRCGVITSIKLALRKTKPMVRTFYLLYDSVENWVTDQRALAGSDRCDHLEGFCTASVQGLRTTTAGRRPFAEWFYGLYVSLEYEPNAPPQKEVALAGLKPYRVVHSEDADALGFAARYDPRFEAMVRSGAFQQAHPVFECLLPMDLIRTALPRVLDALPLSLGDGHRLIVVANRNIPRFFAMPVARDVACFAVLPTGVPTSSLDEALKAIRAVHEMLVQPGGKRYLPGWLAMMDGAAWRAHYGDLYPEWVEAKRRFDPANVLSSALFPPSA